MFRHSALCQHKALAPPSWSAIGCALPPRRKGYHDGADVAHELIPAIASWGAAAITLHGRTRQQRYSRQADWPYIEACAKVAAGAGLPFVGNGDIMSYDDWAAHMACSNVTTCMIGRGALIKPWIFTGTAFGL